MQYFTLIGGFTGFVLTFAVSIIAGKDLAESVFNATIGCIITALLFRAFRLLVEYFAKQIVAEKTRLRDEAHATASELPAAEPGSEPPEGSQHAS